LDQLIGGRPQRAAERLHDGEVDRGAVEEQVGHGGPPDRAPERKKVKQFFQKCEKCFNDWTAQLRSGCARTKSYAATAFLKNRPPEPILQTPAL
jgi:hypothetical protein